MAIELAKAYVQIVPSAEGIQGSITSMLGGEASRAGDNAGTVLGSRLVSTMKTILGGAAIGKFVAESIGSGAELEQSIGGIETLFKDSAGAVKEAAANAYKTAGLSANAYMEQTTSFAASLLQSLGNNTRAAADVAQMAMTDMSDNANKMGTDMVSIQNAYQGFAKSNYTMLDNLKLGYGGTKTEMERLLADAEKITGIHYDLSSLADVYNAIHIIQGELDITGTTAKEAETTLSGSFNAMKAAAENVLGNLALGEEMTPSLEALVDTTKTYLTGNLLPAIGNVVRSVPELVATLVPEILQSGTALVQSLGSGFLAGVPQFFSSALPALLAFTDDLRANFGSFVSAGVDMIVSLANGIVDGLPQLFAYIPDIVINIAGLINDNAPKILAGGAALVVALGRGIIQSIPLIVQNAGKIVEAVFSVISAFNWLNLGASLLQSIGNGVKSMGSSLVQAFQSGFTGALQWLKSLPSQVFNIGKDVLQNFIHAITGKGAVATAATVGVQLVRTSESDKDWGLSDEVVDKAEVNAFKVQNLAKQTGSAVSTAASSAAASTEKTAQAAQSVTKTVLSALTDAATSYSSNEYGQITTSVTELTEHIKDSTGKVYDQLTRTTTESGKELVNGVVKNYKLVTTETKKFDENGKQIGETATQAVKTYEDASKSLVSTLTQTAQTLKNGISTTIESVTKKYQDNSEHIEQTATETGTRIVNGALETYTKVKTLMDGVETDSKETSQAVVSQYDTLTSNYGAAAERVAQLRAAYNESVASTGAYSEQTRRLSALLAESETELVSAKSAWDEYQKTTNRSYVQLKNFADFLKKSNSAFSSFGSSLSDMGDFFDSETLQNAGDFFSTITDGVDKVLNFATSTATLVTTLQELKTTIEAVNATGGISSVASGIGSILKAGGTAVAGGAVAGAATTGAAEAAAGTAGAVTAASLSIPALGVIVAGVLGTAAVGYGIYKWAAKAKDKAKTDDSKISYKDIQDAYWYGNERAFAGYDYRTDPYTFRQQSTMSDYQNKMQAQLARIGEFVEKYLPETGKGVVALDGEEVARIITPSVNANLGQLAVLSGRGN